MLADIRLVTFMCLSGDQQQHRGAASHRFIRHHPSGKAALLDPHAGRRVLPAAVR